jgi:dolichol-phosphate mannosyltransferase
MPPSSFEMSAPSEMSTSKVMVVIPTYNERENIVDLITEIFRLPIPQIEIVVVDDQSPDGTGEAVRGLSSSHQRLFLIEREAPAGYGLAGRDGFLFALQSGADFVIVMDGDFSHQPKHIPELIKAMADCDVAIGSRFVEGGSDSDRPGWRNWLTKAANFYARTLLGLPVADPNSGFRCFSRDALRMIHPESLRSPGPSNVHETLFRATQRNLRIREIPIEFIDRKRGTSKLNLSRLIAGVFCVLRLKFGQGG